MSPNEIETILRDHFDRSTREPAPGWLAQAVAAIPDRLPHDTPAPDRRRWPSWLIRRSDEATRDPVDRGSEGAHRSRRHLMMSATGVVVVLGILAIATTQMLPVERERPSVIPGSGTSASLVVAQDGSGDHATIAEAVEAAADGDTIRVRPGRYVEAVAVVGKDLTITGDGEREAVVVEAVKSLPPDSPPDTPSSEGWPWAFYLSDTDTTISQLTVVGAPDGTAIEIVGASAPVLERLDVRMASDEFEGGGVWFGDQTQGQLRSSRVEGWIGVGPGADATIVANDLPATCVSIDSAGAHATVRDNTIAGCAQEYGIRIDHGGSATISGNDIAVGDAPGDAAFSHFRTGIVLNRTGGPVSIEDNEIHDSTTGIGVSVGLGHDLRIASNRLSANAIGLSVAGDRTVAVGNVVDGNDVGVLVTGLAPTLEGNEISGNETGLSIGLASPVLTGNTVCGNGTNLVVQAGRESPDTSGNRICPDGAVAAGS